MPRQQPNLSMKSSRACAPPLKSPACALPRDSPPPLYFNTVVKLSTPPHAHNHLFRVCSEHGGGARERSARVSANQRCSTPSWGCSAPTTTPFPSTGSCRRGGEPRANGRGRNATQQRCVRLAWACLRKRTWTEFWRNAKQTKWGLKRLIMLEHWRGI